MPTSSRVSFGSPAISPHTATGMPTRCALWMVCEISFHSRTTTRDKDMNLKYWTNQQARI
jgi:hypothetical protein